ncbi:hypothetical protein DL98DRAFT_109200 [Cadophora sp. DSE1049]|nr:hypothetical protein DL98DRAFT_109200 [Cadophora sp. DSE1049]
MEIFHKVEIRKSGLPTIVGAISETTTRVKPTTHTPSPFSTSFPQSKPHSKNFHPLSPNPSYPTPTSTIVSNPYLISFHQPLTPRQ